MKKILIPTAAFFLSLSPCFADFNGDFSGRVSVLDSTGSTMVGTMTLSMVETTNNLLYISEPEGYTSLDGLTLNMANGQLSYMGVKVGTYSDGAIELDLSNLMTTIYSYYSYYYGYYSYSYSSRNNEQVRIQKNLDGSLQFSDYFWNGTVESLTSADMTVASSARLASNQAPRNHARRQKFLHLLRFTRKQKNGKP